MSIDDNELPNVPTDAPPGIYSQDGRPRFFSDPAVDRLVASFIALVGEVWVLMERVANIESIAEAKGVVTIDDIREHRPADAESAAREKSRDAYIRRVLSDLREAR